MKRMLELDDLPDNRLLFGVSCIDLKKRKPSVLVLDLARPKDPPEEQPFDVFGHARFPADCRGWIGLKPLTPMARAWWRGRPTAWRGRR